MTITLDPQLEILVRQKVDSGRFGDPSAVIREALRLLDEQDRLSVLRAALVVAEAEADRGEGRPFTPELYEEIKRNAIRKAERGHKPNPDVLP